MSAGFPPIPAYPAAYDSDYTLFLVYNSTQAALAADSQPYAEEIEIVPVKDCELWGDNGFVDLDGELIYYDDVDRDGQDRVVRLKRCARGMNGFSAFKPAGSLVRGNVVAEHHNQVALATILTEQFVGYNFTPDETSLDWRIRNLAAIDPIADDFACPDVQFNFTVINQNASGTLVSYSLNIVGSYGEAVINFGDGSRTTVQSGTHQYAANANIDPVVTVTNQNCQIVQTPIERDEVDEPTTPTTIPPFTVPVPVVPSCLTNVVIPSFRLPSVDIMSPPIVQPCFDLSPLSTLSFAFGGGGFSFSVASIIFPPISIINPTLIVPSIPNPTLVVPTIPNPTLVVPSIPNPTLVVPSIPPISFGPPPSIPSISFGTPPTFPPISFDDPPVISVDWGTPPSLSVTIICPSSAPMMARGMDFVDPSSQDIEIQYDFTTLPSEIKVVLPDRPISVEQVIPSLIRCYAPDIRDISLIGPEHPLPSEIRIIAPKQAEMPVISVNMIAPSVLTTEVKGMPSVLRVEFPEEIPSIRVTGIPEEIRVTGIPDTIKIEHNIPNSISVDWGNFMPPPLKLDPVEVKVNLSFDRLADLPAEGLQCFALVPCPRT